MKLRWPGVVLALASACALAAPVTVRDDRGRTVSLARPAQRIVTLAPHLTEIAFAAGAGGALAGVSAASDFPGAAKALPVVATHGRADAERILALEPDLVLAWMTGTPVREVARLERLGLAVAVTEVQTLDDVPRLVALVGRLAGTQAAADAAAAALRRDIADLAAHRRPGPPVDVFIEIWHRPLLTVNGRHLASDIVRRCGGRNVFADAPRLAFVVSREQLLQAQPEAVVLNAAPDGLDEARARWSGVPVPAVRDGRLHPVDPKFMHAQGPSVLVAARAVCAALDAR